MGSLYCTSGKSDPPLSLYLNTAGCNGGNGQTGQDGGEGGNRLLNNYRGFLLNKACFAFRRRLDYEDMPQDEFNNNMRDLFDQEFSYNRIASWYDSISGGTGGVGGQPGRNGNHGKMMEFLDTAVDRGAIAEYSRPQTNVAERTSYQGATGNTGSFGVQHADASAVSNWDLRMETGSMRKVPGGLSMEAALSFMLLLLISQQIM